MNKLLLSILALFSLSTLADNKKILVVLSSENKITLKDGITHPTGFFLNELMIPITKIIEAGYEPVFATPRGNKPTMDKFSDSAQWFGGDENAYQEAKTLLSKLASFSQPQSLQQVLEQDLNEYSGIFVPGGHAPMEDLLVNPELGKILNYFHNNSKPTALICHGPIALLSSLSDPISFTQDLARGNIPKNENWIYAGYNMTVFSTAEEKQEELGADNLLGGFVKFYPDAALQQAGGNVVVAGKWQSHAVRDRELITGQNPLSDNEFVKLFLEALSEQR